MFQLDVLIDFVKEEAGHAAAALLEIQGINCVKSLLMTDNVYAIMDVKSKSLDGFKNKCGYMQDDGTFVIQPGIKGNIDYLIDLLKKKCIDDAKLAKSSKRNQLSSSLGKTTDASSTRTKSTSSVPFNSAPETIASKSSNLSIDGHKTYIIDTLNNWWHKNKSIFNLSQFSLLEGEHYFIAIQNDSIGSLKGDIKCCCEKWSSLTLRRGKFQLSNFYRHLQSLGDDNLCHAIKEMLNNPRLTSSLSTNNQQPFTTSDDVPQQVASPNRIPIIPPSDTIQPNSALSTASSISISTDNDESIMQQSSSSLKTKIQVKRKFQTIESSQNSRESAKRTRRR
jgi:hypothetical protein